MLYAFERTVYLSRGGTILEWAYYVFAYYICVKCIEYTQMRYVLGTFQIPWITFPLNMA